MEGAPARKRKTPAAKGGRSVGSYSDFRLGVNQLHKTPPAEGVGKADRWYDQHRSGKVFARSRRVNSGWLCARPRWAGLPKPYRPPSDFPQYRFFCRGEPFLAPPPTPSHGESTVVRKTETNFSFLNVGGRAYSVQGPSSDCKPALRLGATVFIGRNGSVHLRIVLARAGESPTAAGRKRYFRVLERTSCRVLG